MDKRPVYNGYDEVYCTGIELKKRFEDCYLLTNHFSTIMSMSIPTYLTLKGIEDEKEYRIFIKDGLCKVMKADTDGHIDYFGFVHDAKLKKETVFNTICPECGSQMRIRPGKYGLFVGCSGYPKCTHTEHIPKLGFIQDQIEYSLRKNVENAEMMK